MVIWAFCRTQERYDRYRCRFPQNESSLKLIADACSATVVLDLVYKNKTQNARYLGRKIVRNIPVQGWRICKNETAMDYWSVCFFFHVIVVIDLRRANYLSAPPPPHLTRLPYRKWEMGPSPLVSLFRYPCYSLKQPSSFSLSAKICFYESFSKQFLRLF